jgi:alpha-N-arabinofuranosidase
MKRRAFNMAAMSWLTVPTAPVLLTACGGGGSTTAAAADPYENLQQSTSAHQVQMTLGEFVSEAAATSSKPKSPDINRMVLGSNIQWVDRGDALLDEQGDWRQDAASPLPLVYGPINPSALRYPGGIQADLFDWEAATNVHAFTGETQPTLLDTGKFLRLCKTLGSEPVITVNVTAADAAAKAAAWVTAVNVTGITDPADQLTFAAVKFWEIGNEPYLLEEATPQLAATYVPAVEYATRAKAIITAMTAAAPANQPIQVGLPLSAPTRGGTPVTYAPDFTKTVLQTLGNQRIDFVALHNAYLPLRPMSKSEAWTDAFALQTYLAAMAATGTVEQDLETVSALLTSHYAGPDRASVKIAITEFAPLFIQNHISGNSGPEDLNDSANIWSASPAGAMYMTDMVTALAPRGDIAFANHWSLIGNGHFGLIGLDSDNQPYPRPLHTIWRDFLNPMMPAATADFKAAQVVPFTLLCRALDATPSMGLVQGTQSTVSRIRALLTRTAATGTAPETLRLLLIHKDPVREAHLTINLGAWTPDTAAMTISSLVIDPLSVADRASALPAIETPPLTSATTANQRQLLVALPAHSISMITLPLIA